MQRFASYAYAYMCVGLRVDMRARRQSVALGGISPQSFQWLLFKVLQVPKLS